MATQGNHHGAEFKATAALEALKACAICLLVLAGAPCRAAAPTFQSLMDPSVFPEAQHGMRVESARLAGGRLEVVTTGARFTLDLSRGDVQAWGPGVLLRFANGAMARVNSRSDATLMADVPGVQLHGRPCPTGDWVWLRMRWGSRWGVVEQSTDGKRYERVWTFDHGGAYNGETKEVLIGKLSWDGEPHDHSDSGPVGDCEISEVDVY